MRRFAIVGHRAMSKGKLPLNDLAGGAGRMDVLVRAMMAALLTSHGLRKDTEIIIHLGGGPGPPRRIRFDGSELVGVHAEERSIAGQIGKVIATPLPPIGHWQPITRGIEHSGGNLQTTLSQWGKIPVVALDANAPRLWTSDASLPEQSNQRDVDIGFVLSDDQPLHEESLTGLMKRSLGQQWLQGHMAIGVVHFLLDEGVTLNLD